MNCLFWFFSWSSKRVHHFDCSAVWQFLCVFHGTIAICDWTLESLKGIQSKHASWLQNVWMFWSLFWQYLGKGSCFCFVFTLNLSFSGHSHAGSLFSNKELERVVSCPTWYFYHTPSLFMMSLVQTAWYKMAALTVMFSWHQYRGV